MLFWGCLFVLRDKKQTANQEFPSSLWQITTFAVVPTKDRRARTSKGLGSRR